MCSAELLTVYIDDSESALGIDCPLVRLQQGGSKAVKTDSGLLPDFQISPSSHIHSVECTQRSELTGRAQSTETDVDDT